jgi:hypothetical protein
MVATVMDAPPFFLIKPKITLGPAGSEVEFECGANEIDASPEQDEKDAETFCGVFTSYGPEKWTITATVFTSFGANGLWTLLRPFANTVQPFTLLPDAAKPVGVDNPEMSGEAYVPGFPFLQAAVGEASDFDLVLKVQGEPDFDGTGGATQAASTSTGSNGGASAAA